MLVELVETSARAPREITVEKNERGWLVAVGGCVGQLKTVPAGRSADG